MPPIANRFTLSEASHVAALGPVDRFRAGALCALAALVALTLLTACPRSADTGASGEGPDPSSSGAAPPEATSGDDAQQPGGAAHEVAAAIADAAYGVLAPPELPTLMRRVGYESAGAADLAEFAHIPPGASGEVGVFGAGEQTVRVALIAYPNPRYAAPHVNDIRERMRVSPTSRDAVAAHDRWVLHVQAADSATAVEVAAAAAQVLGWSATEP